MMKQSITCSLFFSLINFSCFGQHEPAITQFWSTYASTNPATTGLFYQHIANAHYRNQWDGVNGAPNTLSVNYGARLAEIHGGAGIAYQFNAIGFNREQTIVGNYAFHQQLGQSVLSIGLAVGVYFFKIKNGVWIPPSSSNDPSLPASDYKSGPQLNSNIGIAFHSQVFNAGISCTRFAENWFQFGATNYYQQSSHYWLFLEYSYVANDHFELKPRVQILTDAVKATYMASLMAVVYKNWWGGVNYSVDNYVGGMLGYDFYGKYRVGYGYDYTTNKLSNVSKGTHEIVLTYLLK